MILIFVINKGMKKVIFVAVLAITSIVANAQVWMGGSLGLNFTTPDYDDAETMTTFTIAPEVGYTLNDKWDIAIAINEQFASYDGESANSISVEPYARYTFAKNGNVSFFVDGGFGVGSTEFDNDGFYDSSRTEWYIGIRPGIKVALSEKVGLVAKLGFLGYQNVEDAYESFGFSVNNNSLTFGMYWSF